MRTEWGAGLVGCAEARIPRVGHHAHGWAKQVEVVWPQVLVEVLVNVRLGGATLQASVAVADSLRHALLGQDVVVPTVRA